MWALGPTGNEYQDGMVEHDMHVGQLLKMLDDLGIVNNTIVFYSTDNGPPSTLGPISARRYSAARRTRTGKAPTGYRPLCVGRPFPANTTLNGIVSHEDWLPTFAAAAGDTAIKDKLLQGVELNGP